mgnify:CR=1 FL=1|jgi:M6 family metalloprotease-like protein
MFNPRICIKTVIGLVLIVGGSLVIAEESGLKGYKTVAEAQKFKLEKSSIDGSKKQAGKLGFRFDWNKELGAIGNILWPHKGFYSYKGKRITYFICPEGGEKMFSISVIAHEFGHMLGLPDLYARPEVPDMEGLGRWCSMSNGEGRTAGPCISAPGAKNKWGGLFQP